MSFDYDADGFKLEETLFELVEDCGDCLLGENSQFGCGTEFAPCAYADKFKGMTQGEVLKVLNHRLIDLEMEAEDEYFRREAKKQKEKELADRRMQSRIMNADLNRVAKNLRSRLNYLESNYSGVCANISASRMFDSNRDVSHLISAKENIELEVTAIKQRLDAIVLERRKRNAARNKK